jgi:hypothetical protein
MSTTCAAVTGKSASRASVCGTYPVPERASAGALPSTRAVPPSTGTKPRIDLISVDLPAPFGPTSASFCPAASSMLTSVSTGLPW